MTRKDYVEIDQESLNDEANAMRKRYMDREISHQDYYLWLGDKIGATALDLPVSIERVRASKDEHLNDIALRLWDSRDPSIRMKARAKGIRSWSRSDTVCVLKSLALRVAAEASLNAECQR